MPMDMETLDRVFRFHPNTSDQDADLEELYKQAHRLASAIHERVDARHAEQALGQLAGVLSICRNAVELAPRQVKPTLVV